MSKKPRKTNKSDTNLQMEILKILIVSPQTSMYKLAKSIKGSTFSTIRRNIYRLRDIELLKVGEPEKRKAMKIELTSKGLATLLIDGDLQEKELRELNKEIFRKHYEERSSIKSDSQSDAYALAVFYDDLLTDKKHLTSKRYLSLIESYLEEIFVNSLLEIKPKVNLKFFDEEWFYEVYVKAIGNAVFKAREKYPIGFEKLGIWKSLTEKERQEAIKEFEEFEKERQEAIREFLDRCTSDSETIEDE
jgi:hypothetical protein